MPVSIKIIPREQNIIDHLARHLSETHADRFANIAIVFPNKRLGNYLHLALGEQKTACFPPKILTLDSLGKILPQKPLLQLSRTAQHIVINLLIEKAKLQFLKPGQEREVLRFFQEISEANHDETIFEKIIELLQQDPFHDERFIETVRTKIQEFASLYQSYLTFLQEHEATDANLLWHTRLRKNEHTKSAIQHIAGHYYFVGFTDLLPRQIRAVNIFFGYANCEFWLHAEAQAIAEAMSSKSSLHPFRVLADLCNELHLQVPQFSANQPPSFAAGAFRINEKTTQAQQNQIHIHAAKTPFVEVKGAVKLARQLVLEKGVAPEDIVIAVAGEDIYGELLRATAAEAGLPYNYALGIPMVQTQLGQWLRLCFDLILDDAPTATLLDVLNNRVIREFLAEKMPEVDKNHLAYEIENLAIGKNITGGVRHFLESAEDGTLVHQFITHLNRLIAPFIDMSESTLSEWNEKLWAFTEQTHLHKFTSEQPGAYNQENQALESWIDGLRQLEAVAEMLEEKMTASTVLGLLQQHVLNAKIRTAGDPFIGVQIIGLLEMRGLSPRATIVLGNNEGLFPARPNRDIVIPEPIRARLGFATFSKREKLYDQQFYNLLQSTPELHLFYSEEHEQQPLIPSRYLQRLNMRKKLGEPCIHSHEVQAELLPGEWTTMEAARNGAAELAERYTLSQQENHYRSQVRGAVADDRVPLFTEISATKLEYLLGCPYRFLLTQLGLREQQLPTDDLEPKDIGTWLHEVCQFFFNGLEDKEIQKRKLIVDSDLKQPLASVEDQSDQAKRDRLLRLTELLRPKSQAHEATLIEMMDTGWPLFLQNALPEEHVKRIKTELELNDPLPNAQNYFGFPVQIKGRADRVDVYDDRVEIIDYKLSINPDHRKKKPGTGVMPQLPLYFQTLKSKDEFKNFEKWLAGYFGLKKGEKVAVEEHPPENMLSQLWDELIEFWQQAVYEHTKQNSAFVPKPDPQKICRYCQFAGICRREEHVEFENEAKI